MSINTLKKIGDNTTLLYTIGNSKRGRNCIAPSNAHLLMKQNVVTGYPPAIPRPHLWTLHFSILI